MCKINPEFRDEIRFRTGMLNEFDFGNQLDKLNVKIDEDTKNYLVALCLSYISDTTNLEMHEALNQINIEMIDELSDVPDDELLGSFQFGMRKYNEFYAKLTFVFLKLLKENNNLSQLITIKQDEL